MKQNKLSNLLMMGFLVISVVFTSCTNEEEAINHKKRNNETALAQLRLNITNLNKKWQPSSSRNSMYLRKKSLKGFFSRLINVVVSDVGGAIKGAINGENILKSAGKASAKAGVKAIVDTTNELLNSDDVQPAPFRIRKKSDESISILDFINSSENVLVDIVPEQSDNDMDTALDSIGYYHNKVLLELFTENDNIRYWKNLSTEELSDIIDEALVDVNLFDDIIIGKSSDQLSDMLAFCDNLSDIIDDYSNSTDFCDALSLQYPDIADALSVISIYMEGLQVNLGTDNVALYTENVLSLVAESYVNTEMKYILRSGIVVAMASAKLWIA